MGFIVELQKKKPLVTENNKKIRIEWCKRMENWKEEWDRVVFSDESRYLIFKNDAHKLVWRRCDEKYKQDCLAPTVCMFQAPYKIACFMRVGFIEDCMFQAPYKIACFMRVGSI